MNNTPNRILVKEKPLWRERRRVKKEREERERRRKKKGKKSRDKIIYKNENKK